MANPRTQRRVALITLTTLVWGAALTNSFYKFKLSAKSGISVSLTTKPEHVRVSVDSERQFDGAYVQTPVKIAVPPGRHRIKVARDGYVAHVVTVEGDSGDVFKMDDVVLQKNPDLIFARVIVEATYEGIEARAFVEIDEGLVRGETPLTTHELTLGSEHSLLVYPKGKDVDVKFRCRFTPPGEMDGAEHAIKIKITRDAVKATGCAKSSGAEKVPKKAAP